MVISFVRRIQSRFLLDLRNEFLQCQSLSRCLRECEWHNENNRSFNGSGALPGRIARQCFRIGSVDVELHRDIVQCQQDGAIVYTELSESIELLYDRLLGK